jgi:hypothetical protein
LLYYCDYCGRKLDLNEAAYALDMRGQHSLSCEEDWKKIEETYPDLLNPNHPEPLKHEAKSKRK